MAEMTNPAQGLYDIVRGVIVYGEETYSNIQKTTAFCPVSSQKFGSVPNTNQAIYNDLLLYCGVEVGHPMENSEDREWTLETRKDEVRNGLR